MLMVAYLLATMLTGKLLLPPMVAGVAMAVLMWAAILDFFVHIMELVVRVLAAIANFR